jgi:uncharacterized cupin superfamily protein
MLRRRSLLGKLSRVSDERIVHSEEQPWVERAHGEFFAVKCRRLGHAAGGKALRCNMFELSPGKTAMPFHYHLGDEEALYVLAGAGTLRLGDAHLAVKAGDYVAFPPGEHASHQLTNTSADALRYLFISTRVQADVIVYPDSKKVGVRSGEGASTFARFFPEDAKVDYWSGEPLGTRKHAASATEDDDDSGDLEQRIDDEIADLKKKLGLSGKGGGKAASGAQPKKGARKIVDDALDELDRLKRKLDGE